MLVPKPTKAASLSVMVSLPAPALTTWVANVATKGSLPEPPEILGAGALAAATASGLLSALTTVTRLVTSVSLRVRLLLDSAPSAFTFKAASLNLPLATLMVLL